MPTALIADDEPHLATYLHGLLAKAWPELQVLAVAKNGLESAERIAALQPDFAFLDIKMPGLSGLEVAQGIEGATRVVFVTAFDEFAVAAFEQQALDYVLKPVKVERLARTIERLKAAAAAPPLADDARLATALQRLLAAPAAATTPLLRHVRASQGDLVHQIDVADVLFFHADDKYTCVRTAAGEHLIRTTITELAGQLDPARFQQIHRSTIVNLDHLAGTRRDEWSRLFVRVRGQGEELPVSRAYVHLFKAM
ncbi:MAG: LytTR family DNA-binding domain-containing protein [Burkholderiales bacterium]|nr:LytTR family DNA-binding domain-containing protein [Burkholderiales bacterium]